MESKMLTVEETAKILNTTYRHVRAMTIENGLPYYRIGRLIRIAESDLMTWISSQRVESCDNNYSGEVA